MGMVKLFCACVVVATWVDAAPGRIVFPDEQTRQEKKLHEPITPPVLPVIAHLENDPSTLVSEDKVTSRNAEPTSDNSSNLKPRFGFNQGYDVSPNSDGGLTATFSNGYSGFGGNSQSAAHSLSFGFNKGFQASQTASSSSSFNNAGFASSSSGSQASSFSVGAGGITASGAASSAAASAGNGQSLANSQSAGFSTSFGENSASGSQSASSTFNSGVPGNSYSNAGSAFTGSNFGSRPSGKYYPGRPSGNSYYSNKPPGVNYSGNRPGNYYSGLSGNTYSGNRPAGISYSGSSGNSYTRTGSGNSNFGEGSIDIRNRNKVINGVATSIVFPGQSTRGKNSLEGANEFITFDDGRWHTTSTSYKTKNDGDWLSILISD